MRLTAQYYGAFLIVNLIFCCLKDCSSAVNGALKQCTLELLEQMGDSSTHLQSMYLVHDNAGKVVVGWVAGSLEEV